MKTRMNYSEEETAMAVEVYIGAGSNLGNRFENLKESWEAIQDIFESTDHSSLYETAPLIVENQPKFLNMDFKGVYRGSALKLLSLLHRIESSHGRNRGKEISKGPRTLDLDILLFGHETISSESLIIPHPEILNRSFVLTPLLEVYPEDGVYAEGFRKALEGLSDQNVICKRDRSRKTFWTDGEPDEQ